jgi:hypothetical protein
MATAWLDGEVPPERREAAREHLAECEVCARLVEDLAAVDRAVKEQPAAERGESEWEGFNRRLMVRVAMDERSRAEERARRPRRLLRWGWRLAAAAAALVLASWAGYVARRPQSTDPLDGVDITDALAYPRIGPEGPSLSTSFGTLGEEKRAEFERLLGAAERVLVSLKNADPKDKDELAAIRSAVIDSGLVDRLSTIRGSAPGSDPVISGARPVEMLLRRVTNGSPSEPEEFTAIQSAVVDNALVEHTRSLRARK